MAIKTTINLTYEALEFKIFMDSLDIKFYGKEIFISAGLAGKKDTFAQLLGNVGGYARMVDFDKDISVVILSDNMMKRFKEGDKDQFLQMIEDKINAANTPYRKLKFTTEERVLDYMNTRARGRMSQNKKDLKDKDNSKDLNTRIQESIDSDELMLDMVKRYKESTKVPQQQDLF